MSCNPLFFSSFRSSFSFVQRFFMNKFIRSLILVLATTTAFFAAAQNTNTLPYQMPNRIKYGEGASATYLDKANGSWQNCTSAEPGAQDSTCVVPYRKGVAAGLATVTASFSTANPSTTSTGTKLIWTTANAVRLTVNCTGVATYANANAPLQNSPSTVILTSPTAGAVSCLLVAYNSDNEPTSTTVTATFVLPVPLTLTAGFSPATAYVGGTGSSLVWTTTGAKDVYVAACTGMQTGGFGPGYITLQGVANTYVFTRQSNPGQITCLVRATNDEGQAVYSNAVLNFVMPPPPNVNGGYNPPNINVGQQSQLIYNSENAVYVGLVCTGLSGVSVSSPSLYLNQAWYFFTETWSNAGTQDCGIQAINQAGESIVAYFRLVVAPVATVASGGGSTGITTDPNAGVDPCGLYISGTIGVCGTDSVSNDDGPAATDGDGDGDGDG
jgi:hypothetical protein